MRRVIDNQRRGRQEGISAILGSNVMFDDARKMAPPPPPINILGLDPRLNGNMPEINYGIFDQQKNRNSFKTNFLQKQKEMRDLVRAKAKALTEAVKHEAMKQKELEKAQIIEEVQIETEILDPSTSRTDAVLLKPVKDSSKMDNKKKYLLIGGGILALYLLYSKR